MVKILPFARPDSAAPSRKPVTAVAAEIVIFPGVRIQYDDRPLPPGTGPRRGAKRRSAKNALTA
jgi:hypothetical protein